MYWTSLVAFCHLVNEMNCCLKIYVGWGLKIVGGVVIHVIQALYPVSALWLQLDCGMMPY